MIQRLMNPVEKKRKNGNNEVKRFLGPSCNFYSRRDGQGIYKKKKQMM